MNSGTKQNKLSPSRGGILCSLLSLSLLFAACTFDYGQAGESDKTKPDIVMENIEYVRVRGGDPQARFLAEYGERWEDRRTMELKNFTFEQMEDHGETVNAEGRAGAAVVQLGSGDISLSGGVRIRVDSEDVIIHTSGLEWKDKEKILSGRPNDEVDIERSDGTSFSGVGFKADARNRTWDFTGAVKGLYVEKEEEKETPVQPGEGDEQIPAVVTTEKIQPLPESSAGLPEAAPYAPAPVTEPPAAAQPVPEPAAKPAEPPPDVFYEPKPSLPVPEPTVLPEDK